MKSYTNISVGQLKAILNPSWMNFRMWFNRRWIGITAFVLFGWMVYHKDISINFSMQKGEGALFETTSQSLFYDPFEDDERIPVKNVSLSDNNQMSHLTSAQKAKRIQQLAYVKTYTPLALHELHEHGIPPSITLAQGLLESNVGESRLARENNNHFGIKCFSKTCRKGHCSNFNDDHHKDFFRTFGSVEESYAAHSQVLAKDRYKGLFRLKKTDYKGWARGLRKAGYATDPRYADKLIRIIDDLQLYQYDI